MDRIGQWLGTLSIKAKILAGFACVLVILLAVAGIGYWRFQGVAASLRSYVQRVGVVEASRIIDHEFEEMRRHVREFAFTGNPDEATAAIASADRVKPAIDKGLVIAIDPERHHRMQEIATLYEGYRSSVDTVFGMKRDKDTLISETLDPAGTAAREDFDKLIESAVKGVNRSLCRWRATHSRR